MTKNYYNFKVSRIDIRDSGIYFIVERYHFFNGKLVEKSTYDCEYLDSKQLDTLFDKYFIYRFFALTIRNKRYTMYELLDAEREDVQIRVVVRGFDSAEM